MSECVECGDNEDKLYSDPRVPPVEFGGCLCQGCFEGACEERIEELENEISEIKDSCERAKQ